jgi:hypothetical protein
MRQDNFLYCYSDVDPCLYNDIRLRKMRTIQLYFSLIKLLKSLQMWIIVAALLFPQLHSIE